MLGCLNALWQYSYYNDKQEALTNYGNAHVACVSASLAAEAALLVANNPTMCCFMSLSMKSLSMKRVLAFLVSVLQWYMWHGRLTVSCKCVLVLCRMCYVLGVCICSYAISVVMCVVLSGDGLTCCCTTDQVLFMCCVM